MARTLARRCGSVELLGPVTAAHELLGRARSGLSRFLTGRGSPYHHTRALAREYAKAFRSRIPDDLDVLYAPAASAQIALLETDLPIVYASDATFPRMVGYHPGFSDLPEGYLEEAMEVEGRALERADRLLYPTTWAASSAVADYGVPEEKVVVVPFGANLDPEVLPSSDTDELLAAKGREGCRVLFLATNWERKGGDTAVGAVRALRRRGLEAELTVCGCTPPRETREPWMRVIPRLDKDRPEEQRELSRLLLHAHVLVLPTLNDCFGIVFCEASAHGTPSLAADTGGVRGAVEDGVNGFLLEPGASGEAYADRIGSVLRDRARYRALVASTRRRYDEVLNWDAWADAVCPIVGSVIGK